MALQSKMAQTLSIAALVAKFSQLSRSNVPGFLKFSLLHLVSRITCYWLPNLILWMMQSWRIQGATKMPNMAIRTEAFYDNIATDVFKYYSVGLVFHKILTLGSSTTQTEQMTSTPAVDSSSTVTDASTADDQDSDIVQSAPEAPNRAQQLLQFLQSKFGGDETNGEPAGWSGLRFGGPLPNWWTQVGYIGYDAMFYWSHRALHHKSIYKYVHKRHHEFHTPVGTSASHEHPFESLCQLFNWYLPIGVAGWMNGELHWSTLLFYNCFRWLETVDAHSGYELPFSPFHALPMFGGATMHDYHHRAVLGNFGASRIWDWLCSTDKGYWEEVLEEGFLRGGQFVPAPWTILE